MNVRIIRTLAFEGFSNIDGHKVLINRQKALIVGQKATDDKLLLLPTMLLLIVHGLSQSIITWINRQFLRVAISYLLIGYFG